MTASANGSILTGPTATGSLTDATGGVWTLSGGVVSLNGKATVSSGVITLEYANELIYQENGSKAWWSWQNNAWVPTTAPVVAVPPPPPPPPPPVTTPTFTQALASGQSILITFPNGATATFAAD